MDTTTETSHVDEQITSQIQDQLPVEESQSVEPIRHSDESVVTKVPSPPTTRVSPVTVPLVPGSPSLTTTRGSETLPSQPHYYPLSSHEFGGFSYPLHVPREFGHIPYPPPSVSQAEVSGLADMVKSLAMSMTGIAADVASLSKEVRTKAQQQPPATASVPGVSSSVLRPKPKEPRPLALGTLTSEQWATEAKDPSTSSSRDRPRTMAEFCADVYMLRAMDRGTSGQNGSMHYPLRILKKSELRGDEEPPESATNANSLGCAHYYVDSTADIGAARSRDKKVEKSGYYQLTVPIPKVEANLDNVVQVEDYILNTVDGNGEHRAAVWQSSEKEFLLSVRVFEYSTSKGTDGSKPRKLPGVDIFLVDESGRSVSLSPSDEAYRKYSGHVRVVFTPSVVTVVKGYKKMVYKCTSLVLSPHSPRLRSGMAVPQKAVPIPGVDEKELDELYKVIKSLVGSGIKVSVLINYLISSVQRDTAPKSSKLSVRPAPRVEPPNQLEEVQESEEEEEQSEEEEDRAHESEGEEEEEEEEEEPSLTPHRFSKGKAPVVPRAAPPVQSQMHKAKRDPVILDPPGSSVPKQSKGSAPRPKFPLKN